MATAQVLFQRFFYVASLKKFSVRVRIWDIHFFLLSKFFLTDPIYFLFFWKDIGMGALFLASKVSESPCKIRDLINVYHYLISRYRNKSNEPLEYLGQVRNFFLFLFLFICLILFSCWNNTLLNLKRHFMKWRMHW